MQNSVRPMPPPFDMLALVFFSVFLLRISATFSSPDQQAKALLAWKNGFNLTSASGFSSFFDSWQPSDAHPCNWSGITCSHGLQVTEINIQNVYVPAGVPVGFDALPSLRFLVISSANLTGPLPAEIGSLASLQVLDLSGNSLAGPIPRELGKLKKLRRLVLSSNLLQGQIPAEIGECTALEELVLFDNELSGSIPASIGALSNLQVFRAGGNPDLSGELPPELGNCSSLVTLGLAETKISGSIPATFGSLKKLQTLAVYTTMLSGPIPAALGDCSELTNLYLYENGLSGAVPATLGRLKRLEKLLVWQNEITGSIPPELGNCSALNVIDLSLNRLSGPLPTSFGRLQNLSELQLSVNNISGPIPTELGNCSALTQLQLDNNQIQGHIPAEIGRLRNLAVLFTWQNRLSGSIPAALGGCESLQALDLSHNALTGEIPKTIFELRNLTKILLLENRLTGNIPAEVGSCSALLRLRLSGNSLVGRIPATIGLLDGLIFLDVADNQLSSSIPEEIGGCTQLQMLDLHGNQLSGAIPESIGRLTALQVVDLSGNALSGALPASLGKLTTLNKLILNGNRFAGSVPTEIGWCTSLELMDLSGNAFSGNIPPEIGKMEGLSYMLNLSCNRLTGALPETFSGLTKLAFLDLSHNFLSGDPGVLAGLQNLVSLNISYNNFSGQLPDTTVFQSMSLADWTGNPALSGIQNSGRRFAGPSASAAKATKITMSVLFAVTALLIFAGVWMAVKSRRVGDDGAEDDSECSWPWQMVSFQRLTFAVEDIVDALVENNVIGKGCSGVVYRADMGNGEVIAVKKLWATSSARDDPECLKRRDSFSTEIKTLGSIRHRNIVRLLGCCTNRRSRLLLYDYMPNGSLGGLLHEKSSTLDWEIRYNIVLGAAQGLAYLHHDCRPPILHRDVKANNILLGAQYEPYLADFGLAKLVDPSDYNRSSTTVAGSYGYIAPEYGYTMRITEKSDVYSFGVVLLEVITGKEPIDPTIPEGQHLVDWVRGAVQAGKDAAEVIDPSLQERPESQLQEMLQVLGVAFLCVSSNPEERPTMKDVAALLKEIRYDEQLALKQDRFSENSASAPPRAFSVMCSSASTSARHSHSYSFHSSSV